MKKILFKANVAIEINAKGEQLVYPDEEVPQKVEAAFRDIINDAFGVYENQIINIEILQNELKEIDDHAFNIR